MIPLERRQMWTIRILDADFDIRFIVHLDHIQCIKPACQHSYISRLLVRNKSFSKTAGY
jgi:hypothetical protein